MLDPKVATLEEGEGEEGRRLASKIKIKSKFGVNAQVTRSREPSGGKPVVSINDARATKDLIPRRPGESDADADLR